MAPEFLVKHDPFSVILPAISLRCVLKDGWILLCWLGLQELYLQCSQLADAANTAEREVRHNRDLIDLIVLWAG